MKVELISHTARPKLAICMAVAIMMKEDPDAYVNRLSGEEKRQMISEIMKSRLRGALGFASFEFYVTGVTRAFTHQLVRHRTFHFSQQSMRFFDARESEIVNPFRNADLRDSAGIFREEIWDNTIKQILTVYSAMIDDGVPIQDARGLLPHAVTTKIMFGCNFRNLLDLAEVRMCRQTQGEFRELMDQIKKEVMSIDPFLGSLLVSACQRSGRCEFKSIYDRPCPIEKTLKGGESYGNSEKENIENEEGCNDSSC